MRHAWRELREAKQNWSTIWKKSRQCLPAWPKNENWTWVFHWCDRHQYIRGRACERRSRSSSMPKLPQPLATKVGRPKWISMQNAMREEWASSTARSAIDQRRRDAFTEEEVGKHSITSHTKKQKLFCANPKPAITAGHLLIPAHGLIVNKTLRNKNYANPSIPKDKIFWMINLKNITLWKINPFVKITPRNFVWNIRAHVMVFFENPTQVPLTSHPLILLKETQQFSPIWPP